MQIAERDIVILQSNKKRHLVKVTNLDPLKAIVCDEHFKSKELAKYVEFENTDIICNLGSKPAYGMSYGVEIEYIRLQLDDKEPWESIKFYKKYNETEQRLISKSLDRVSKNLEERNIFPKEKPIEVHVKEPKGPHYGTYTYRNKEGENLSDILTLKVKDFGELEYCIYHELGHGVWFQLMNDKLRARWIRLFYQNISLITDLKDKVKSMREELVQAGTIKAYSADLEEDNRDIFKNVIAQIKKQYNIKPMHINILIADGDDLTDIWPKKVYDMPQATVLVTDYSTTCTEELFSESFAFYFTGKKLPKVVLQLMEKTISLVRYGSNSKFSE